MGKKKRTRLQIIQGMKLGTVLRVLARNDFRVDTPCFGRLAYLLVFGVFNSIYGACETFYNAEEINATEIKQPPLFIIGHWRSGTTHLHNLLSLDESFTCPSAYQAMFPHHFIFSQVGGAIFNLIAPKKRPMDNVAFSSDTPHEDEFALAAHSTVSPYMRVLFPVTGDNGSSEVDPQRLPEEALQAWKRSLIFFIKKLTLSEGGRIVLKSPPHLGRVSTLLDLFPDAQFVHIVRNPYDVYASTHKLWKDSFAYSHLQVPGPGLVDKLILSWYTELFSSFERDRAVIPPGSLHEMKFEDLEDKPLEVLKAMYDDLGLNDFDGFQKHVAAYLQSIRAYRKNVHHLEEADREKVRREWGTTFERYGYSM